MKKIYFLFLTGLILCSVQNLNAQRKTYVTSGGEAIFSWGELAYTDAFKAQYTGAEIVDNPVRFTVFLHFQTFTHLDLSNSLGFYSGLTCRNVGMITDEVLPTTVNSDAYQNAKIVRRTYSLGIPLAFKIGSFSDHFYIYGGGEYEWQFVMKEKYWDQHSRDGNKTKNVTWWPDQLSTFIPSAFVGIQLPHGANIKFQYYLENFMNHDYTTDGTTFSGIVSDLSKYESSQMMFVSLSFMFNTSEAAKKYKSEDVAYKY